MITWTLFIAAGLLVTIIGIVLTFISRPPTVELARARKPGAELGSEMIDQMIEQSLLTNEQIRAVGEEIARKKEQKLEFSVAGIALLILGAGIQLIGTVGQVIVLACRR